LGEVAAELDDPGRTPEVLRDVARADAGTQSLMAPQLLAELERRPDLGAVPLDSIVDVLEHLSSEVHRARLRAFALERFARDDVPDRESLYLAMAFRLDAPAALDALIQKIDGLEPAAQTGLVLNVLPHVFGGRRSLRRRVDPLPLPILERLVRLAFQTIRIEEDNQHPSGVVYSPDDRDDAEEARNAAFKQLSEIPGRATFNTLMRFSETQGFPISPSRLRELARNRAAQDSEFKAWPASEAMLSRKAAKPFRRTPPICNG
jgi:hypothetical protein